MIHFQKVCVFDLKICTFSTTAPGCQDRINQCINYANKIVVEKQLQLAERTYTEGTSIIPLWKSTKRAGLQVNKKWVTVETS